MKKKLFTILGALMCAVILVVGSIAGTIAYLRSSAEVVNSFTYGKVNITMDETLIGADGLKPAEGAQQRVTGNRYKLMPNTTYTKDPVIHVGADSEEMYLFLKVDNGIYGLAMTEEESAQKNKLTIHDQLLENGWKVYKPGFNGNYGEYSVFTPTMSNSGVVIESMSTVYYLSVGSDENAIEPKTIKGGSTDIITFTEFTTGTKNVTEASMTAYVNNNAKISVTAFAVQKSGFNNIDEAALVFTSEFASAIPAGNPDLPGAPDVPDVDEEKGESSSDSSENV